MGARLEGRMRTSTPEEVRFSLVGEFLLMDLFVSESFLLQGWVVSKMF